jgi:hypothetical protein
VTVAPRNPRWSSSGSSCWGTLLPPVHAQAQSERPYSCRLLDDEERRCSFDPHCDRLVIERLVKECRRDGGRDLYPRVRNRAVPYGTLDLGPVTSAPEPDVE